MSRVKSLGFGIYQIELAPIEEQYNTTGYLVLGKRRNTIIETGTSRSNPAILQSLQELNLSPCDIHAILATHIHLDHSGGAGLLMEQCSHATMYIHEKGLPHLVSPERLIAGSRAVYGRMFDTYFHPVQPVPKERIQALHDGDRLDLGEGRTLRFVNSPGHALHHMIVYDEASEGIFTGDAAGIYYPALEQEFGVRVALPSTTPTQFDPEATLHTLNTMLELKPRRLYYTHFGMGEPAIELLQNAKSWLGLFGEECVAHYRQYRSLERMTKHLQREVIKRLAREGVVREPKCLEYLKTDNRLNAMGLVSYCERLERKKEKENGG